MQIQIVILDYGRLKGKKKFSKPMISRKMITKLLCGNFEESSLNDKKWLSSRKIFRHFLYANVFMFILLISNCWRALARKHTILYNSEKKKSVGCKIEDMRSRLCFLHPGIPGCLWSECTWKYRSISSNSPAQLEIKDTINEVKYGCL